MGGQAANVFEGAYDGDDAGRLHDRAAGSPRRGRPARHSSSATSTPPPRRGPRDPDAHPLARPVTGPPRGRSRPACRRRFAAAALAGREDQVDLVARAGMRPGTAQLPHGRRPRATVRASSCRPAYSVDRVRPGGRRGAPAGAQRRPSPTIPTAPMPAPTSGRCSWWVPPTPGTGSRRSPGTPTARSPPTSSPTSTSYRRRAGQAPRSTSPTSAPSRRTAAAGWRPGLLAEVLRRASGAGYVTASLNVDTDNPTGALGIYERAGFRPALPPGLLPPRRPAGR